MTTTVITSPLPALDSPRIEELLLSERTHCQSAYETILRAERDAVQQQAKEDIIYARVVGYKFFSSSTFSLISLVVVPAYQSLGGSRLHLSALTTTNTVSPSVLVNCTATNSSVFVRSSSFPASLDTHNLSQVQTPAVLYPPPSSNPSRPSFDALEDMVKDSMEPAGKGYRTARKKVRAFYITLSSPRSSRSIRRLHAMAIGTWSRACSTENYLTKARNCGTWQNATAPMELQFRRAIF
jgi:hypothetical protein